MKARCGAFLSALCALFANAAASAEARRPLTIDDVLRMEQYGRAEIALSGRLAVYEQTAPYEQAPNIEAVYIPGVLGPASKLYAADLTRGGAPHPLFEQDPRGGYWIGALSPDGARLAIYSVLDRRLKAGVVELASRRATWFDFTPNYFWSTQSPVWISNEELIYPALPPGEIPSGLLRLSVAARYNALWEKAFAGREPSATVVESHPSGVAQAERYRAGRLLRVNARTGETSILDEGYFYKFRLSPDGRYLAALKQGGMIQPTAQRHTIGSHHQLVVFDLSARTRLSRCAACSLTDAGLLQWSADSRRLAFAARPLHGDIEREEFRQFWPATNTLKRIPNSGLLSSCGISPIPVGSGEAVVVFSLPLTQEEVSPSAPCPTQAGARWDWHLIDAQGRLTNLTASFEDVQADFLRANAPVGIAGDALYVLADGNVQRLETNGERRQITHNVRSAPEPWILGLAGSGIYLEEVAFLGAAAPTDRAVLQTQDEILVLDLARGAVRRIRKPEPGAKLLSIADGASDAIFREDSHDGARLVATDGRTSTAITRINAHLAAIAPARRAEIAYDFENTRLTSCMLLPPNFRRGRRYPLVVWLYPRGSGACVDGEGYSPSSFELLAARGYVVLYAANPKSLIRTPESPLGKLTPVVLAGIDAAVREGYADANRIGVYGWSQGNHAVLQMLTETDRFRAAIVGNGISNALSHYGSAPLHQRMLPEPSDFGAAGRYENESGPNGLGAKPWDDPMRFVRNSPVLHADRITTPLLIFHSDFDQFPLEQSEQVFSALYRLRREATYVTYWGEAHGILSPANIRDLWARIFDWYDRRLAPPAQENSRTPPLSRR